MNKKYIFPLILISFFQMGFIQTRAVKFIDIPSAERWMSDSSVELNKKLKTVKDPLARAAASEALQQYENCVIAARQVPAKSIVYDKVLNLELRCAKKLLDEDAKLKLPGKTLGTLMSETLARFEKNQKFIKPKERESYLAAQVAICVWYSKKAQWKSLKLELAKAYNLEMELSKSARATLYALSGEMMIADRKWSEAFLYFNRAKDFDPEISVESKIKNIISLLPAALKEKFEKSKKAVVEVGVLNPSPEEQDYFDQAQSYIAKSDIPAAAEAMAKILKNFPQGLKSKWAQDKIYELLSRELEKSRGPDGNSVIKNKIIRQMLILDSDHIAEWGRLLFDVQAYSDAALFYEKAAELSDAATKAPKFIYMTARSYQLAGNYSSAKDNYKKIAKSYAASTEAVDGAIQWALININENELSEAITHLEMSRSRKLTSQQDLVSLFWLFQVYKNKNENTLKNKSALELVERFPLTYYGIIAYNELNQKLPSFDKEKVDQDLKISLSQGEWKVLDRVKVLFKAGMLDDASEELNLLTQRANNADEARIYSDYFAQSLNYPKVFSLLGTLFDENVELRSEKLLKTLFPKEFWNQVNDEKKRAGLDPFLLLAVMRQESAFRPNAVSRSGAIGLLQMIPPTAEEVKKELGSKIEIPKELFEPANNVKFCAFYLAKLIKKFEGSIPLALAAYNAGPTRISQFVKSQGGTLKDTWVDELPLSETSFYVKSILKNYLYYRMIYAGQTTLGSPPWSVSTP